MSGKSVTSMQTRRRKRRSLSLIEAVISIAIVSVLLVAALETTGASVMGRHRMSGHARGHLLAVDLMSEIMAKPYEDPDDTPVFGLEGGENPPGRTAFDDVDDYDAWTSAPPQHQDGTPIPGLDGWARDVAVVWALPADLTSISMSPTDIKRITVTVSHNDAMMAELVALRTPSLPPPSDSTTILMVVQDNAVLTSQEADRMTLLDSWGYQVNTIGASDPIGAFTQAAADADVAYLPEGVSAAELGTKLRDAAIGVVNEEQSLNDELGISSGTAATTKSDIYIVDNTHYITSGFNTGFLTVFTSSQPVYVLNGFASVDLVVLARTNTVGPQYYPSLAVLEAGDILYGGGTAAARRVQLPWGAVFFDFNALNADGQTLLRRAIEWAANQEDGGSSSTICGDKDCGAGEDPCTCPEDCGPPADSEKPGATCNDGLDNDCNGATDCDDIHCSTDPACQLPVCGNGVCEASEDCYVCPSDCPSLLDGSPSGRYCCGNGTLEAAEGDGSICDGNP